MFKLVVLFALISIAVAKPGYLHGAVEVAPIIAQTYLSPAAVSSTYRHDVINKPAVIAYAAAPVFAEHVAVAAPIVAKTIVAPAAVSHSYRADVVSSPVYAKTIAYNYAPAVHAW